MVLTAAIQAARNGAEAHTLAFMYKDENYLMKIISDGDFLDTYHAAKRILKVQRGSFIPHPSPPAHGIPDMGSL